MYQDELYHHGVKGQKWGIRRTLEELGHKVKARRTKRKRIKALKKARAARVKAKKIEEKAKKAVEKFEKNKEKIRKDPILMNKYKDYFTTEEINEAKKRFDAEKNLALAAQNKIDRPRQYFDIARNYVNSGVDMYESIQKVSKIMTRDEPLPEITPRSKKEAERFLKSIEKTALKDVNWAEVKKIQTQLKDLSDIESYEKEKKGN